MNKIKKFIIVISTVILFTVFGMFILQIGPFDPSNDWPNRHEKTFNKFFGKDNWECVNEREQTTFGTFYYNNKNTHGYRHRNYFIWSIKDKKNDNIWDISSYNYITENYGVGKRSSKTYLNNELLIILYDVVNEDLQKNILEECLSKDEIEGYKIGLKGDKMKKRLFWNPRFHFLRKIGKENWFNVDDVSAKHFLDLSYRNYYIYVNAPFDENPSMDDMKRVNNNMKKIIRKLYDEFGNDFAFYVDYYNLDDGDNYIDTLREYRVDLLFKQ